MYKMSRSALSRQRPDYIVVGAGSAGCVVTRRLLEAGKSVTLIEAGKSDRGEWDSWKIHMPSALAFNIGDNKYNWNFNTVPQRGLDNRILDQPRGKVLGGSSALNAMAYVRGNAFDYERWGEQTKAKDFWNYPSCLAYFKKLQMHMEYGKSPELDRYRGKDGLYRVTRRATAETSELNQAFVNAGVECGYGYTEDQNGFIQEGFGPMDMSVDYKTGERNSTMNAYLKGYHENNKDCEIETVSHVGKLLFKDGGSGGSSSATGSSESKVDNAGTNNKDAVVSGVEVVKNGRLEQLYAEKEVILCAGSVGSTQILQLSGIGNADELKKLGIQSVVHNPDVGENLEDHLEFYLQYKCKKPVSLYPYASTYEFSPYAFRNPLAALQMGVEWMCKGSGLAASNHFEVGGFLRTRPDVTHPDVQFHFIPGIVVGQSDFLPHHGYQAHVGTMRPKSRGTIKITSTNPNQYPLIDPAFLTTEADIVDQRAAFRLGTEIMQAKVFDQYNDGKYGDYAIINMDDDAAIDRWVRQNSHSGYHLSCTCKMGKVTNPRTAEVYNTKNLRVIDASVMPSMSSGNLNAPTIMLAEKLVDTVIGNPQLPPEDITWFKADTKRQRGGFPGDKA